MKIETYKFGNSNVIVLTKIKYKNNFVFSEFNDFNFSCWAEDGYIRIKIITDNCLEDSLQDIKDIFEYPGMLIILSRSREEINPPISKLAKLVLKNYNLLELI